MKKIKVLAIVVLSIVWLGIPKNAQSQVSVKNVALTTDQIQQQLRMQSLIGKTWQCKKEMKGGAVVILLRFERSLTDKVHIVNTSTRTYRVNEGNTYTYTETLVGGGPDLISDKRSGWYHIGESSVLLSMSGGYSQYDRVTACQILWHDEHSFSLKWFGTVKEFVEISE